MVRTSASELKCWETKLHNVPLVLQRVYGCRGERSENWDGEEGRDCRLSCLQMAWFFVTGWRRT